MADDKSQRPGRAGRSTGKRSRRGRATRPPIIDVEATEIPGRSGDAAPRADKSRQTGLHHIMDRLKDRAGGVMAAIRVGRDSIGAAGLVAAGLAAVVLAGLIYWVFQPPAPDRTAVLRADMAGRVTALTQQIEGLERRLDAVLPALKADRQKAFAGQTGLVAKNTARIDQLTGKVAAFTRRAGVIEQAVQAGNPRLGARLDQFEKTLTRLRADMAEARLRAQRLDQALKTVDAKIAARSAAAERAATRPQPPAPPAALRGLSPAAARARIKAETENLIKALKASNSYAAALEAYAKLVPGDPLADLVRPFAVTGAPVTAQLKLRAETIAGHHAPEVAQPARAEAAGFYGQLVSWSRKLVKVRRTDKVAAKRAALWRNIAAALDRGRLDQGLRLALSAPRDRELSDWIAQAERRLLINRQIGVLERRLSPRKVN